MTGRLGVLVSGRGSNLQAILDAAADGRLDATVAVVVANVASAPALERARAAGVPAATVEHRAYPSRPAHEAAMVQVLRDHGVGLVCLAGYMRLLGPELLGAFPDAVLNIHPSLLPAFPGVDAPAQAIAHGVKVSGCTVHFVTAELDAGPIIRQAAVPVRSDDTAETLAARILVQEHRLYAQAIAEVLAGGWRLDGRRFIPAT